jgi:cell division septation protein DedD
MKFILALALLIFVAGPTVMAQGSDPDINSYIAQINNGQGEQVRTEIPALMAKYPNNPGVLYLQGLVTSDGGEAVRIYQSIVDNFPKSEWADDALFKVYQFYYALGLYRTAELKMNQLRKEYPDSKHLQAASAEPETKGMAEEHQPSPVAAQPVQDTVTQPVRNAVAQPAPEATTPPALRFALQVGAFTTQVNAEKQKQFFEQLGYPVEVLNKVKDNRALFLVWVGTYPTYDEAKAGGVTIKKKYNIASIVISR